MPRRGWRHQGPVHLPRDISLQAPHRLPLAFALGRAPRYVIGGSLVAAHPAYDDAVQRPVGPAVAAPVEPGPVRLAAGRLDRAGPIVSEMTLLWLSIGTRSVYSASI